MRGDIFDVDPELAELFPGEPGLLDLARHVRAVKPDAPVGENFQAYLRARLMDAAPQALRRRGLFGGRLRVSWLVAGSGATLGAAMAAITIVSLLHNGGDTVVNNIHPVASITAGAVDVNPDQAITIAFDQPMDHSSVERAIHIQPATSYSTSWSDDTLTITPAHHLAANTAYVVRLDQQTARSTSGGTLVAPVVIPFGTKPAPTPSPTPTPAPPMAAVTVLGQVSGGPLVPSGDGGVLAGALLPSPAPSASPSATPSASPSPATAATPAPSASPRASATAAPSASPTAAADAATAPELARLDTTGTATALGPQATAVVISPAGRSIAYLRADGDHADVLLANLDGSRARVLTTRADAGSPLAWTQTGILFAGGGHVRSVDLGGVVHDLGLPPLTPGGPPLLLRDAGRVVILSEPATAAQAASPSASPSGTASTPSPAATASASAAASPAAGAVMLPAIVDLAGGTPLALPATATRIAVSRDGSTVVWVQPAIAGAPLTVERAAIPAALGGATLTATAVPITDSATGVSALAVSDTSGLVAATVTDAGGTAQLLVVDASGHLVAVGPALAAPVFTGASTIAGLVGHGPGIDDVVLATVGGAGAGSAPDPNAVAAAAGTLLDHLVAVQAPAQPALLAALPTTGATPPNLVALTPPGLTQAYAVTVTPSDGGATVTAIVHLIHIPSPSEGSTTPTGADEAVTLVRAADGSWAFSAASVGRLAPEVSGPHVQHVTAAGTPGARVLELAFDSDLDPSTVAGAISVSGLLGAAEPVVTYDAATRTVLVSLPAGLRGETPLTVSVGTGLRDVDGNALSSPYSTTIRP